MISALCVLALAWLALAFGAVRTPADLARIEWIVAAFGAVAVLAGWRFAARRRERHKLDAMRDSALW